MSLLLSLHVSPDLALCPIYLRLLISMFRTALPPLGPQFLPQSQPPVRRRSSGLLPPQYYCIAFGVCRMGGGKRVNGTPLLYASAAGLPRRESISPMNTSVGARCARILPYMSLM